MRASAVAVLACALAACHRAPEPRAIDAALAACIPPDAALIGGADLAALRRSPLYAKLPEGARGFAAQLEGVSSVLAVDNGRGFAIAARGRFASPPAGATMLAPNLALSGSPEEAAAAAAQYKTGRPGAPGLLAQAEKAAAGAQAWIAARGNAPLPISGNAASVAQILRKAAYYTVTLKTGAGVELGLRALAPDGNSARAIEETLRADFTLAAAGESKRPDVAGALRAAQVTRDGSVVSVALLLDNDAAARLLAVL